MIVLALGACGEREEVLGNGYKYIELSRGNGAIVNSSNRFVVYPNVTNYSRNGRYIFGNRILATDNIDRADSNFTSNLGTFILDTNNGHVREAISDEELNGLLNQ
jgi:hypothetical protein